MHTCEDGAEFLGIALCDRSYCTLILRSGIFDVVESVFTSLFVEGIAGAHVFELDSSADVACLKLVDLSLNLPADAENLGDALFSTAGNVCESTPERSVPDITLK